MSRLDLRVTVHGEAVGRITRTRDGLVRFTPDSDWVDGGQRPRLGLAFLTDPAPRAAGTGLPVWFEGLLPPVGSALRARVCAATGLRETDSAGVLRALGRDLPGAVEVIGEADPATRPVGPTEGFAIGFSLAGMQLKFSVAAAGERFALPARDQDGSWILKVPSRDFRDLPEVEAATMTWASATGLPTPEHRVVSASAVDGLPPEVFADVDHVFAVRRFDRADGFRRIHQEDLAQALEIHPQHLYGDTGPHRTSNDALVRLIDDACGREAALAFIDRLAFIVASGNGDAHLKNHSIQWPQESLRPCLSPVYDQVAIVRWAQDHGWLRPRGATLGLPIGRSRRVAKLDHERLGVFEQRCRVPGARARFTEAVARARAAWAKVADQAPEPMRVALSEHWRRAPVLRSVGELNA